VDPRHPYAFAERFVTEVPQTRDIRSGRPEEGVRKWPVNMRWSAIYLTMETEADIHVKLFE
jgi:hypothetical protein